VLPVIAWVVATLLLHFGWVRHGVERGGWPWGEAVLAGFAIAIVVTALTLLRDRRRRKGLP
jgi:hypothetical protein